jgi:predicted MFS family arabinose efflux permease/ribosomal protein S18 acetylase RimI-like enzyme
VAATLGAPANVLFLALFASQAGVLVLSPILSDVAADLGVSVAMAGQLRILAAPLAAVAALAAARALARYSPRALLAAGSTLLALGSLASAVAPTFALLALAQVPMWAGIATLMAAGVAASAAWSAPGERTRIVARMFAGPPAAWIVGMPVIGLVAEAHWRLAFAALPLPAALLAGLALAARSADAPIAGPATSLRRLLGRAPARRWALGELAANSAWAGTLVFSGALFTELYGLSSAATGLFLAAIAAGYLVGNQLAGRSEPARARRAMLEAALAASGAVALTWAFTPSVAVTVALFAATAALAASRTVAGTVYGFSVAGGQGREVGAVRAVATQIGYLIGSLVGGVALALGGFAMLAVAFGGLFLVATLPHVRLRRHLRPRVVATAGGAASSMQTRVLRPKHGPGLLVRPLRNGDVETVQAVFERLGGGSRRMRFNGPKPHLTADELRQLATVDASRHALVAYVEGDERPVAIARLVREGSTAEIAFEVVDAWQQRGIGSALAAELVADARAAGVTEVTALVASDNRAAVALLRRILDALEIRYEGPELSIRAALA